MNIKLKIRPFRHKKRPSRGRMIRPKELTPEKRRKIEELKLARSGSLSQLESPEISADKEKIIPPPKIEYVPPSEEEYIPETEGVHIQPPKEEFIPSHEDEGVPETGEDPVPEPKEELVPSSNEEYTPPSFGGYTKPPKKSRTKRPKKSRIKRPKIARTKPPKITRTQRPIESRTQRPKKTRVRPSKKGIALGQQSDALCRKIIEWGIIGLLVFSPLPAASVHKWSVLLIQLVVFAMFGAYVVMNKKPKIHPQLSASLKWPRYLFVALFVLIAFQMTPLPKFLIKALSPNTHYFRALFSPEFLRTELIGMSLIPSHTFQKGLELLAYFLLGYLIIKTVTGRRQIMRILYVLIGMAVFQALYGFFELYSKNPRILFYEKLEYLDCVTGTFINRNHLSGYLEMILPVAIGLVLARTEFFDLSGLSWKQKLLQFTERKAFVKILIPVSIVAMALAIIFSKSRSGIFLLVLTFLLIFEFTVLHFRKSSYRKRMISRFLKITFLIITVLALYIGIEGIIKRFSMERFLHEYRPIFWSQTARIIEDFPVFGSGLGTFESMYPVYAKSSVPAQLSHAHNDYLEYLSELGIFGVALLLGGIVTLLVRAYLVWRKRTHPYVKGLGLGGFIAIILLLLHSLTDFNLHIPANMILFSVILSLTAVTVFYQKSETDDSDVEGKKEDARGSDSDSKEEKYKDEIKEWQNFISQDEKSGFKSLILFVSTVILVLAVIAIYWNSYFFGRGKRTENNAKKVTLLKRANILYPKNDLVHLEMGKANFGLGREPSQFEEVGIGHVHESIGQFETSLKINPLSGFGHLYLGKSSQYLSHRMSDERETGQELQGTSAKNSMRQDLEKKAHEEYKKAVELAGPHIEIYTDVGKEFFREWNDLSDEDKRFTVDFVKKLTDRIEREGLLELMDNWEKHVRDYSVMDEILPNHLRYYRIYANFLGERSLSSQERHRYMTKAEEMRFELAREEFRAGENAFMYRSMKKARDKFNSCQEILGRVRFYQKLTGSNLIDLDDFRDLEKSVPWMLARCGLTEGQDFEAVQPHLEKYLELENNEVAVGNLEDFLKQRNLIGQELKSDFDDLNLLAFHMDLILKQRRYREVINVGRAFEEYFPRSQVAEIKSFLRVMQLVGDALMKIEFFSDACVFYQKALDVDPINLEILVSLREACDRAGHEVEAREASERIERLVSPQEKSFDDMLINKGERFSRVLKLDGGRRILTLGFENNRKDIKPLITVWINNRVIWEDYLEEESLSLPLETLIGDNRIVVTPLNTDLKIQSIAYQ